MPDRPIRATWMCTSLVPLLAGRPSGIVRLASARALDIEAGGRLVWMVASGSGRLPGGIGLDLQRGLDGLGLVAGAVVRLTPSGLEVGESRAGVGWDRQRPIRFDDAAGWDAAMPRAGRRVLRDRLSRSRYLVPVGGFGVRAADLWHAWPAIDQLQSSLRAGDRPASRFAARQLIGLGPGLTPSGDDVLVGCGAALAAFGHPDASAFSGSAAAAASGRTTAVAQAYHDHAAAGRFSEHLQEFVATIADPEADLEAAVGRAAAWGATSGADALLGALVGAEACPS